MEHSSLEYDKVFAAYNSVNAPTKLDSLNSERIDNLIHESTRLQLNTYQTFVRNVMNPMSDMRSLMLVHMTGTGKTITALATATEYVKQYHPSAEMPSVSSIVVLGFTKDIFAKELLSHPEFKFVNMDEVSNLKELEQHMHDSATVAEQYISKKKQYQRRLAKREVRGIYQFYGYRQFANRVINMEDVQQMLKKQNTSDDIDAIDFDPKVIKQWIDNGDVRVNTSFVKSLSHSLFICDEVHNLYKNNLLNTYGLAVQIVFDYYFNELEQTDMNYGSIRSMMLSATPLTSSPLEIIPIIRLLSGEDIPASALFKLTNGIEQLTNEGISKIRHALAGKISYIMDDNPKEYPSSEFIGEKIPNIEFVKFIRSKPIGHQKKCLDNWEQRGAHASDERGSNMIKDIVFPAVPDYPHGVIFGKNVDELANLPEDKAVHRAGDGFLSSKIFSLPTLREYSCKYAKIVQMCMDMKTADHGKIFIYHPFVQGSGTELLCSLMTANGFIFDGDYPSKSSLCMHCNTLHGNHTIKDSDHEYEPVRFTFITGSLSKTTVANRLAAFNNAKNLNGERIKILIGSRAMRESHTLKTCRNVFITHDPSSISEMIQIIGRAVRKHVHAMLPPEQRSVKIHIFTTNVEDVAKAKLDTAANEELAYYYKVLYYKQINRIERIMYDVAIDYLINFRFKLRETPPLLGEAYSLNQDMYRKYEKVLTKAYANLRNGIALTGVHTHRFNLFHFNGEVEMVMIIIKRVILDHQPLVSIKQIYDIVRRPPFYVEYNTQLISDEAISVAISKLIFKETQLRIIFPFSKMKLSDSLYDKSPTLIDTSGRYFKIVCIGDPLCMDSYLTKRQIQLLLEGDNSMIDTFRQSYVGEVSREIDLKELADNWANTIDIDDIVDMIRGDMIDAENKLTHLPINSHSKLAEWAIENAAEYTLNKRRLSPEDLEIVKFVIQYYTAKRLIFTIRNLKYTRLYDRYKKLDVDTGASWFNKSSKLSTAGLPIGHLIELAIRTYQSIEHSWIELNTIKIDTADTKYPYGFYIYEEKQPNSTDVAIKFKYTSDDKAKGITMLFLQRADLEKIATALKANIKSAQYKPEMIDIIMQKAYEAQDRIYPKRVIYRLVEM